MPGVAALVVSIDLKPVVSVAKMYLEHVHVTEDPLCPAHLCRFADTAGMQSCHMLLPWWCPLIRACGITCRLSHSQPALVSTVCSQI
jgi:hypothetical protein